VLFEAKVKFYEGNLRALNDNRTRIYIQRISRCELVKSFVHSWKISR